MKENDETACKLTNVNDYEVNKSENLSALDLTDNDLD
jgi:hypothetical protein